MKGYEFTLRFLLPADAGDPESHLDALGAAGCDDALVGVGQPGRIALDFNRRAGSALAAMSAAVRDVRRAIPGATLIEAAPDFVGLTDVADIAGFSRQNMRKLMLANAGTFPPAVHDGRPALWHLADVLAWLRDQQRDVDPILLELAATAMQLNIAGQSLRLPGAVLPEKLRSLFA